MVRPRLSIPIRARSLHPMRLSQQLLHPEQDSAWMARVLGRTTVLSSDSGVRSNTKRSTCGLTIRSQTQRVGSTDASTDITRSDHTHHWEAKHQTRFTEQDKQISCSWHHRKSSQHTYIRTKTVTQTGASNYYQLQPPPTRGVNIHVVWGSILHVP